MKPLDHFETCFPLLEDHAHTYKNPDELKNFQSFSGKEVARQLKNLLEKPLAEFTSVNEAYFRARWAELLRLLHPGEDLVLLEIASGDADMIPQAMARTHPKGLYITANMNKALNDSLSRKTESLALKMNIIEDDAVRIADYTGKGTVDVIAFQHAVNDVIQSILCDKAGIDTVHAEWMELLPRMIELVKQESSRNTLAAQVKEPFLELMRALLGTLRSGGYVAMNHYLFQLDLDWGYPPDVFEHMIPMTREWLRELKGCREITPDGFDSQWWIFLQKIESEPSY